MDQTTPASESFGGAAREITPPELMPSHSDFDAAPSPAFQPDAQPQFVAAPAEPIPVSDRTFFCGDSTFFSLHWALQSIKRGNRAGMQAGLTLTFLMGLTFLLTQLLEYARIGFTPHDQAFGTVFFSLTGLHGAHVFVGLTILAAMTTRAFRGHFSPEAHLGVEIGGIYWHFVDVMWIVVYFTVYII